MSDTSIEQGSAKKILDWQRRLAEQPRIWCVFVRGEATGNLYESRAAAQFEADWLKNHGTPNARVSSIGTVHSLELSREQWT